MKVVRIMCPVMFGLISILISSYSEATDYQGPTRETLTPAQEAALTETISNVMREFVASWAKVTCEDQTPFLRFFDLSGPGLIDSDGETVTEYSGNAWPEFIRKGACSRAREEGNLDSLLVRVLSADVVSVSWAYHATVYGLDGTTQQLRGTVLQVFRRTPDGWKTPVGMSTHHAVETPK